MSNLDKSQRSTGRSASQSNRLTNRKQKKTISPIKISGPNISMAEENISKDMSKLSVKPNQPQRIELPGYFNTPRRYDAFTSNMKKCEVKTESKGDKFALMESNLVINSKKRIKDQDTLSFACRRAGKLRDEGRAQQSIGVLWDNLGEQAKANDNQVRFLDVCKKIGDVHGEALAYNCMGVDWQKRSVEADDAQVKEDCLVKAIEWHGKHREIADNAGKYLAHVNLGQAWGQLGREDKATANQQFALNYSTMLASPAGQSVAIGSLGSIGNNAQAKDAKRTQMQVEEQLKLAKDLKNKDGESSAHQQLGNLKSTGGNYTDGSQHFYNAMKLSEKTGDRKAHSLAKCSYGIANAQISLDNHLKNVVSTANDMMFDWEDNADKEEE